MISTFADRLSLFCSRAKSSGSEASAYEHISPELAILIIVFTFLIFANTINHYFVMDDFDVLYSVKSNPITQALLGYGTVLTGRFFRPIPMLLFWLQFKLFGPWPVAYHVSTLLQHALCAILAANLFYLLFKDSRIASIFGFVFVVFPNHAEVINSIAINLTSVATLFFLATLNMFCYYRLTSRKSLYALAVVSFLAAILSHEMTYTLPFVLVMSDLFLSRSRDIKIRLIKRILEHFPWFLGVFGVLIVTREFFNTGSGYVTVEGENILSMYLNNVYSLSVDLVHMYLRGIRYLLVPLAPGFPYSKLLAVFILSALSIAAAVLVWTKRLNVGALIYCLLFVVITLLPVIGTYRFQAITHWVRFLYLPSIATCYVISLVIGGLLTTMIRRPFGAFTLLVALLSPVALLTKSYDKQWIAAEDENRNFISALVQKCRALPPYSRAYVLGVPQMKAVPRIDYALASAVGLYCDRTRLQVDSGFLPAIKILDLAREPYDNLRWNYFSFSWNNQERTLGDAVSLRPDRNNGEPAQKMWDFSDARDNMELEVTPDISQVFAPRSRVPLFRVEGGLALLKLPPIDPGPPIQYLTVEMMMTGRGAVRDVSRIFWATQKEPKYAGERSIGFYTAKDGEFHEYKVPLYRNGQSLTDPDIVRFAIRPSQEAGTIFTIRKMKVEYY